MLPLGRMFTAERIKSACLALIFLLAYPSMVIAAASSPGSANAANALSDPTQTGSAPSIKKPNAPLPAGSAPVVQSADPVKSDTIEIQAPKLQALISITRALDPYRLDAASSRTI